MGLAAVIGHAEPLLAQDGGVSLRFSDLSYRPTHLTVDGFEVELANLDETVAYQVVVTSSNADALGIGGCGTASQTRPVTGVASQALRFVLYACAVDSGTVTAEVRRTGADTADASASRSLRVLPSPDDVPAAQRAAPGAVPRAGTPGIVSGIHFDSVMDTSFRAKWSPPSDGGSDVWSYGILLWTGDVDDDKPGYGEATTITSWETFTEDQIEKQAKTFSGLASGTTHHFLMHACNPNGCGHWSYPAKQIATTGTAPAPAPTTAPPTPVPTPNRPHTIKFHDTTTTSVRVTWSAPGDTGGAPLTGFDLRYWPYDPSNPDSETGAITQLADGGNDRSETLRGLASNTAYELKMRACNQAGNTNCSRWSDDHRFTTDSAPAPPPGAPSFGSAALSSNLLVGYQDTLTLPAASGGTGTLTYQLAPAVGNGLTFDAATRTLAGTPQSATNLATFTYTVTDAANKTSQIPFHLTVFDVRVRVSQDGFKSLATSTWGVLGFESVVMREVGFARTDGHEFRLRLPASTGFQFGQACRWPAALPTATTMLESPWVPAHRGLYLARCGLGSGGSVSFEVKVRRGETAESLYSAETTIERSWHRHDRRVLYYIEGTLANGDIDGGQMFPTNASMTPNKELTDPLNYQNAAKAWEYVKNGGVTLARGLTETSDSTDVVISGYWHPGFGIKDKCGGSVACVRAAGTYPHLGNDQDFLIEDPPRWPEDPAGSMRMWTTEITDWLADDEMYEYLPRVFMHEFGHTLGLGHSTDGDAIMGVAVRTDLSDTDIKGLKATYAHHPDDP